MGANKVAIDSASAPTLSVHTSSSTSGSEARGQGSITMGIQASTPPLATQLLHLEVSGNVPSQQEQNSFEGTGQKKLEAV